MEADGLVNFGGNFYAGYGEQEDMYYAGNNTSFTPNTNPPALGYNGVNSHVYITGISASDVEMTCQLDFDHFTPNFPRRAGYPGIGISPVAADIDGDGLTEIVAVSDKNLLAVRENGGHMFRYVPLYYDTSYSSTNRLVDSLPLLGRTFETISAGPVVGDFGTGADSQLVAIAALDTVYIHTLRDDDFDGLGDLYVPAIEMPSLAVWMSFGQYLDVATVFTNAILMLSIDETGSVEPYKEIPVPAPYGFARIGDAFTALAGDTAGTYIDLFYVTRDTTWFLETDRLYSYGPVVADLNRDSLPEVIMASPDGYVNAVTIDTSGSTVQFVAYKNRRVADSITSNPVVADLDDDGYADIIFGGVNKIYAVDRNLVYLTGFPATIDREILNASVVSTPVVADINGDEKQDILSMTSAGNLYAFGPDLLYGFPLGIGGVGVSSILLPGDGLGEPIYLDLQHYGYASPVLFDNARGGGMAVLAADGWIYCYDIVYDPAFAHWPMYGGNPSGSFNLPNSKLADPEPPEVFSGDDFFCYPNPTKTGMTTIRYYLGLNAEVALKVFDMSGRLVDQQNTQGSGGLFNEFAWDGSKLPTGVYRCYIEANFGDFSRTAYTDIAIVK